ncbi:TraI domain-containing protein [Xenorhabdus budapestensis]|uniref:TraI domain-containing protein n=1 Tax=Xenorhabdus budapestensis TaxID=290110 RepID=UPI001FCFC47B|nr:TraI domain-containing protein [Xenorhabdus budapestensis]
MFQRFKSHFARQSATPQKSSEQQPEAIRDSRGYFRPQSADELLATSQRRQYLQQLWQNTALPEGLYQRFYLAPVKQLLSRVQQVPATPEGNWSGSGNFADLTLKFTTCAVRLAKGHLLPPRGSPGNSGCPEPAMAGGCVLDGIILPPAPVAAPGRGAG